jgi:teichuronic acid biosynthesis glycosyltransferase TuaC
MHILVVSSIYPKPWQTISGGFIHRAIVELLSHEVDVMVVCPIARFTRHTSRSEVVSTRNFLRKGSQLEGVSVSYLPYWNFPVQWLPNLEIISQYYSLRKWVRASGLCAGEIDVVHAHRLFPTGGVALKLAKHLGLPLVCSARGSDVHTHPQQNRLIKSSVQQVITEADHLLAVSHNLAIEIQELAPTKKPVQVIYNGVDTEVFRPVTNQLFLREKKGLPNAGLGVCAVGRLAPDKGALELLAAFSIIAEQKKDIWLCFVGDGPLKSVIQDKIQEYSLVGRVFVSGFCLHHEVAEWINAADVVIHPSYKEGLPNAVLEAMACQKPVIATNVGGIPEIITNGITGLLISPHSITDIVDALQWLLQEPELMLSLASNARIFVCEKFSWSHFAYKQVKVYRDLLGLDF